MGKASSNVKSDDTTNESTITQRAIRGTLWTLLLRLVSFICTQSTLRFLDNPSILGRASIQLELLLTTVLFVSREGFRLALTRNLDEKQADNVWNVAWLSLPMSLAVSLVALTWHWISTRHSNDADYRLAGSLFCISCILEGFAEPAVLHTLREMNVSVKASAEGMASVAKALATVILLQWLQQDWPVTAFGLAQLVYAAIYFVILWRAAWKNVNRSQLFGPFNAKTCYMVIVFTVQGFFKHLLTEGDRLVLTALSGAYDQGIYAMASAYGSLAARIVLQPMEENARLLWSRLAGASVESSKTAATATATSLSYLQRSYTDLVKLFMYIGFTFSCLAVNYTGILLSVMAGRKWGDNPEAAAVLSAFCVYTAFMAWNGMTEAFVYSVASSGAQFMVPLLSSLLVWLHSQCHGEEQLAWW
jgi:oligosaccharide translocation protein RFT1